MLRLRYAVLPLIFLAVPASASMTVDAFLQRANPIRDGGVLGMLSPDMPALRREATDALARMRAERDARRAAGKAPLYCKPADAPDPSVDEMIDGLNDIPARQARTLPLKDGIVRVMAWMYPCR
ncbi:MAG TPA: hypothetical protein VFQ57_00080 [Sphingomonas sp.]|jgi:hypothetical protein|nr:hypothetical protein [Sphingomonas sp.]